MDRFVHSVHRNHILRLTIQCKQHRYVIVVAVSRSQARVASHNNLLSVKRQTKYGDIDISLIMPLICRYLLK